MVGRATATLARVPIAWRLFVAISLVVVVVLGGALAWTARSASEAAAVSAARGVTALRTQIATHLAGDVRGLEDGAVVFARSPAFRSLLAAGAPEDALDQAREAADRLRAAWVQVTDARGVRLAKSDEPAAPAASLTESPLVRGALAGRTAAAYGTLGDTALAHVVAVPVEGPTPGVIVGSLLVARPVDAAGAQRRAAAGGDVAFYLSPRAGGVRLAAATLARSRALAEALSALVPRDTAAGSATASPTRLDSVAPGGAASPSAPPSRVPRASAPRGDRPEVVTLAGEPYLALAQPVRSAAGRAIGGFVALRARDAEMAAFAALRRSTLVAGGVGLLVALVVAFFVARQITRPLGVLARAAERAAAGDYAAPMIGRGGAEVGTLARALAALLDDLREKQVLVEFARLSHGRSTGRRPAAATPPEGAAALRGVTPTSGATSTSGRALGGGSAYFEEMSTARFARDGRDGSEHERGVAAGLPAAALATAGDDHWSGDASVGPARGAADIITAAAALRPGQLFAGRYRVQHIVGAGGSGVVFRAHDEGRDRVVALKVLRPDVARDDPAALSRLAREAETMRALAHPNIVATYELGEAEGLHYLTMEFVDGPTLREVLDTRGPLPTRAAVASARQLCRALAHAHTNGVVHRDVKPHNAIVSADGTLRVMDFGIARFADAPRGITETGIAIGTPAYMAPEVLRGGVYDARADVYSVGVVLFECLLGRLPFDAAGGSPLMIVTHVLEDAPPDPCALRPEVPRALGDLVLELLAKDPARRPADAGTLVDRLAAFG